MIDEDQKYDDGNSAVHNKPAPSASPAQSQQFLDVLTAITDSEDDSDLAALRPMIQTLPANERRLAVEAGVRRQASFRAKVTP